MAGTHPEDVVGLPPGQRDPLTQTADAIQLSPGPPSPQLGEQYTALFLAAFPGVNFGDLRDAGTRAALEELIVESLADRGEAYRNIIRDELSALAGAASGYLPNPLQANVLHAADPVAPFNGQFVHQAEDLRIAGAGIDFVLRRTYRSQVAYSGSFGANWDHAYNVHLLEAGDQLRVTTGDLRQERFTRHPVHGYFVPPDGVDAVINEVDDSFVRRSSDGTSHVFARDPVTEHGHRLARLEDRFGNSLEFSYGDGDGLLNQVLVNHPARFARFDHDDAGRVVTVHDHTGRRWRYGYDDLGDLVTVTTPGVDMDHTCLTTSYEYTTGSVAGLVQHSLTRIVDAANRTYLENEYGLQPGTLEFGRVTRQRQGTGETTFEYESLAAPLERDYTDIQRPAVQAVLTHRNGHRVHHVYNQFGNLLHRQELVLDRGYSRELIERHRYNVDGNLVGSLSPEGTLTQRLHGRDWFLRVTGLSDAEVATDERLTATVRVSFGRVLATVRRARQFDFLSLHLAHGVWGDFPDIITGLEPDGEDIVVKHTYESAYGQPVTSSDPRFTRSPDPGAVAEDPRHEETLTHYVYEGPDADPTRFLVEIRHPTPTAADGTAGLPVVESFRDAAGMPAYDDHGRLLRRTSPNGVVTEHTYLSDDPTDPRSGFLHRTVIDPDGLASTTETEPDELGRPVTRKMPLAEEVNDGRFLTTARFDALDRVVETVSTAPFKFRIRTFYDRCGQLSREERDLRDADGRPLFGGVASRSMTYDEEFNLLVEEIGGGPADEALRTRHRYDGAGRRVLTISPAGDRTAYAYDERGLPAGRISGAGTALAAVTRQEYDGDGRVRAEIDARGNRASFEHDSFGRVLVERDPLGHEKRIDYDKLGNPTVERRFERRGETYLLLSRRESTYDELGRIVRSSVNRFADPPPSVSADDLATAFLPSPGPGTLLVTQTFYDPGGRVVATIDPTGASSQILYDSLDRPVLRTDPLGHRTEKQYDLHGNLLRRDEIEPLAGGGQHVISARFRYDELGRVTESIDALGNITSHTYDSRGNETRRTNPLGNVVRTEYDLFNRRSAVHEELTSTGLGDGDAAGVITRRSEYDADGRLGASIDALGRRVEHEYDALGQRTRTVFPDGSDLKIEYDPDGNLSATIDGNGTKRRFTIDAAGQTTRVEVDGEPAAWEEYIFDGLGRCVGETNADVTREISFDSTGLPTTERTAVRRAGLPDISSDVSRGFDVNGNPSFLVYPNGRRVEFDRDATGRLERIRNTSNGTAYPGDPATAGAYDLAVFSYEGRRRARCEYANGTTVRWSRDAGGRLIEVMHAAASPFLTLQTLHDATGNLRLQQELDSTDVADRFGYDSAGQLVEARPGSRVVFDTTQLAPPSTPSDNPVQPLIDALLGPLAANAEEVAFTYDLSGNRQRERHDGDQIEYAVNALDQYTTRDDVTLGYDGNGNLLTQGQRRYTYDSRNRLRTISEADTEILRLVRDASGRVVAEVANGQVTELVRDGDDVIAEFVDGAPRAFYVYDDGVDRPLQIAADRSEHYFHVDHLGSVRALSGNDGQPAANYRFTPFGIPDGPDPPAQPYNPLRYVGRRLRQSSGTYEFRAREYEPRLGRFLQRDPAGNAGASNLYAYVGNNPTRFVDPSGAYRQEVSCEHCYGYVEAALEHRQTIQRLSSRGQLASWLEVGLVPLPPEEIPTRSQVRASRSLIEHVFHAALPSGESLTRFERRILDSPPEDWFRVLTDPAGSVVGYEFSGNYNTDVYTRTGRQVSSVWSEPGLEEPDLLPSLILGGIPSLAARAPRVLTRGAARAFSGRAARTGSSPLTSQLDEAPPWSVTIGPAPSAAGARPTVPLPNVGERHLDYGTRVHQEHPRIVRETNPGAAGTFNVLPGQTGPDLANPTRLNATFGEMKSLWDRQSRILKQVRKWGYEPESGRIWFYDRNTGLVFEGIIQTDKFPSGRFRP